MLQALLYDTTAGDEVEDLLVLLMYAKQQMPQLQAVSCGAIASDYQRLRVEHVRSATYAQASMRLCPYACTTESCSWLLCVCLALGSFVMLWLW